MKPTLDRVPQISRSKGGTWHETLKRLLGREPHEGDFVLLECVWAGQSGHEKCGYCMACHFPRWVARKECKHPTANIWRNI